MHAHNTHTNTCAHNTQNPHNTKHAHNTCAQHTHPRARAGGQRWGACTLTYLRPITTDHLRPNARTHTHTIHKRTQHTQHTNAHNACTHTHTNRSTHTHTHVQVVNFGAHVVSRAFEFQADAFAAGLGHGRHLREAGSERGLQTLNSGVDIFFFDVTGSFEILRFARD